VFDTSETYSDPNVQAWAEYYAKGGRDLAGAVYFLSIPGLTDGPPQTTVNSGQAALQSQSIQQQQTLTQSGPGQSALSEPSGLQSQQPATATRLHLDTQTSPPSRDWSNAGPNAGSTVPYGTNPGASSSAQLASSSPTSPMRSSFQQHDATGGLPQSTFVTEAIAPLRPHQVDPSLSQPPIVTPHDEMSPPPGAPYATTSAHVRSSSSSGHDVAGDMNVSGYPQRYSLSHQFTGLNVAGDTNQTFHSGQQQIHQTPQGVDALA
jgi:signal transducing adaptor molecule